jgi:hypothetical protein
MPLRQASAGNGGDSASPWNKNIGIPAAIEDGSFIFSSCGRANSSCPADIMSAEP